MEKENHESVGKFLDKDIEDLTEEEVDELGRKVLAIAKVHSDAFDNALTTLVQKVMDDFMTEVKALGLSDSLNSKFPGAMAHQLNCVLFGFTSELSINGEHESMADFVAHAVTHYERTKAIIGRKAAKEILGAMGMGRLIEMADGAPPAPTAALRSEISELLNKISGGPSA